MEQVAAGSDPLVGQKLGSCRVEKKIGMGGMGSVYLAHHGPSDQDVAVKILSPALALDDEYVQRFLREGEQAKKIDHPNVVRVVDTGKHEGLYYIVMEYVRGKGLDEILREERRLSFAKATRIIRDVAKGLEAAQAKQVIHRDIKPANILVDFRGVPKLSDFGLAKQAGQAKGLTVAGMFMGTPEYVSPEQAEGRPVDFRTDVYSLGVTYYQLLSGKLPFTGQTDVEMAMKRLKAEPRPLEDAYPEVDKRAIPIVMKMIRRELDERYRNARELLVDLNPLAQGGKKETILPVVPRTATVIGLLPAAVQRRINVWIASLILAPSLLLFLLAGAFGAGAAGFWESLGAALKAAKPWIFVGLGMAALGTALFVLRRELKSSGRVAPILSMLVAALTLGFAATATLDRAASGSNLLSMALFTLTQPANLMVIALSLGVILYAMCIEMDEDSKRPIAQQGGLVAGLGFWLAFASGGVPLVPIKTMGTALQTGIPLLLGGAIAAFAGIWCLSSRSAALGVRRFGAGLLGLSALLLLVFGAAGAAGTLGAPPRWSDAVAQRVKDAVVALPRSGALALVAVALMVQSIFTLRAGVAKTQAFYRPKKGRGKSKA